MINKNPEKNIFSIRNHFDFDRKCSNLSLSSSISIYCSELLAVSGAYRIFIALSIFHCFLFFATLGVTGNESIRAKIHNGYWGWKIFVLFVLIFSSFFIKTSTWAEKILMIIGMVGASVFLVVQSRI